MTLLYKAYIIASNTMLGISNDESQASGGLQEIF